MAATDHLRLLGLDVGGTKIGLSVTSGEGRVLVRDRIPTDREKSPEALLERAIERLGELRTETEGQGGCVALGVATPGPLSYTEGKLLEVPNMPRWQHFPIQSFLQHRIDVPVAWMNDANASVLAEWYWGAARGASTAIFLTMSTGCGAGLLIDGRVFEGRLALAGEIGHIRLREDGPVGFGKRGSVEGYLSGPGMVQVARAEALCCEHTGEETGLRDPTASLDPARICALARQGDAAAVRVLDRCGHELGRLCAWLTDLLNPDVIVMGTIGTAHADLFVPRARAVIDREALPAAAAHVQLRGSGLSDRGDQTAASIALRCHLSGLA